ncbi:CIR protein [Plasmodium chabaudi chabaudi]|uniref:CIR protein n=1 Tax=Plasmodium chabaudi chabaudi TaxID=31271 RepID=A0A4V0K291_PLACU|nr:CIR protein [Plasmodium chabaudi chabaudi]VTZ66937.1 CIR protein [Plasmodium chabaudi chabaudi]|eukprot:XP_016653142.1 CIR protein [Plasmodium chabaudi chabaudi]
MSKEVCEAIKFADEIIVFDKKIKNYTFKNDIFKVYCPYDDRQRKGPNRKCDSGGKILGAVFVALLNFFGSVEDYEENLKNDSLSEYAILWLNSKIDRYEERLIGVDAVYDMLTRNDWFGEHYNSIKKKSDMMKLFYTYLTRLYELLKEICNTITKCNNSPNTEECEKHAKKCVQLYQGFVKEGPKYYGYCNPYCRILSNLKKDYENFRKNYTPNNLPELNLPNGIPSCESLCKNKEQETNTKKPITEVSEIATPQKNSLPDQLPSVLSGHREKPLSGIEGHKVNSDSIKDKLLDFLNKLKGKEGESPVILRFQQYLRDSLQGLEGGSNGQHNVLSGQSSGLKSVGGISPKQKGLRGHAKEIIGLTQGLNGEEGGIRDPTHALPGLKGDIYGQSDGLNGRTYRLPGLKGDIYGRSDGLNGRTYRLPGLKGDIYGRSDGLNGRTYRLPGLKGDIYGQSDGLNGRTQGLNGQEGESPVILRFKQYLRDSFSGLEGGSNWKYSVLNSHSEFENVGGISPKINGLGGYVKKTGNRTQKLKGQSDLRHKLPGLEGDFYDQYGRLDGLMEGTGGWTQGLKSQEGGSLDMEYGSPHLKNESKNNSTTLEDNVNSPRKITNLFFDNPLGYSKSNLNDVKTQQLHPNFNGNKVIYIVVAFISILIILGISYKYLPLGGVKKLKRKKKMKKIINMCVKNKIKRNLKYIIENNQRGQL